MNKELEALKNIRLRCHSKSMQYDPIDFDLEIIEEALIELEQLRERDRFNSIGKSSQYSQNVVIK